MTVSLPASLDRAYHVAATELGFSSAARLFVAETEEALGAEGVEALRHSLGRRFPVLDAVAAMSLRGEAAALPDASAAREALEGLSRVLVVGIEADALDALCPLPARVKTGLLMHRSVGVVDWGRVAANLEGDWELVPMDDYQRWAGSRAGVLTFAYGVADGVAHVTPEYLRLIGGDTRSQFRALLAWDLLPGGTEVYPRWLAEAPLDLFSRVV